MPNEYLWESIYFQQIPFESNVVQLLSRDYDNDLCRKMYQLWVYRFAASSINFYWSRYSIYLDHLIKKFLKKHNLPSPDILFLDFESWGYEFEAFSSSADINLVRDEFEEAREYFSKLLKQHAQGGRISGREDLITWLRQGSVRTAALNKISEYWFNTIAIPPYAESTIKHLRQLDYKTEYLKSKHWRRVRTAMMVVHDSTCQSDSCHFDREPHRFGTEYYIHVHHKTYANLGNERFADLTLLCDDCHSRLNSSVT